MELSHRSHLRRRRIRGERRIPFSSSSSRWILLHHLLALVPWRRQLPQLLPVLLFGARAAIIPAPSCRDSWWCRCCSSRRGRHSTVISCHRHPLWQRPRPRGCLLLGIHDSRVCNFFFSPRFFREIQSSGRKKGLNSLGNIFHFPFAVLFFHNLYSLDFYVMLNHN